MTIANRLKTKFITSSLQTDCIIGRDLLANLHKIISDGKENFSAFLVLTDKTVFDLYGKIVAGSLAKTGKKVIFSVIKTGEKQKDITLIPAMAKPFFDQGFDRNACLVALGGGVITDIGGFLASILLRGINFINIPTTLLGQADAAIGGKNGINFRSNSCMYKNMLGTFKQPSLVISDVDLLFSLPKKEIDNGMGEIIKYWVGWGKPRKSQISNIKYQIGKANLLKIISECQQIKLDIVRLDPFEKKGFREKLNLGHTIGHAIEAASNGKISHGEAVSLGLVAAAKISLNMKILSSDRYQTIVETISKLGLPFTINNLEIDKILSAINFDKKGGTFVLIKDIGKLVLRAKVKRDLIIKVILEMMI